MIARDEIRSVIKSLNKGKFTTNDLISKLPHISKMTISMAINRFVKSGEVVVCGSVSFPQGGRLYVMQEGKLREKYVRPVLQRRNLPLEGWRKVFPELFKDPKLPGVRRFIDNGLGQ